MTRIIREARPTDMAEIRQVMDAAKKTMVSTNRPMVSTNRPMVSTNRLMRQSGNMHQWGEGYPSEAVITAFSVDICF